MNFFFNFFRSKHIAELESKIAGMQAQITTLSSAIVGMQADIDTRFTRAASAFTHLKIRADKQDREREERKSYLQTIIGPVTVGGKIPGTLSESLKDSLVDRVVAPVLPADHPKVEEQRARDDRFSPRAPVGATRHTKNGWFTLADFYNNHAPDWFNHKVIPEGALRVEVAQVAKELNVTPLPVRGEHRHYSDTWPVSVLVTAASRLHHKTRSVCFRKGGK